MLRSALTFLALGVSACVIPQERADAPASTAPDRFELGLEPGVSLPDCEGCDPGLRMRATGLYRTAPEIPIAVGAGVEYARFRYTYARSDSWPDLTSQARQLALQVLGRYYMWSQALGSPGGGSEGWLDLGLGYDSLGSDRDESSECDLDSPLVLLGAGAGYRLSHNALVGAGVGLDGRIDLLSPGRTSAPETPPCREVPDRATALGNVSLMTRISF
ncbi:MAG: hypothetical protein R3B89_21775 [Polyangiaceae bacterium]